MRRRLHRTACLAGVLGLALTAIAACGSGAASHKPPTVSFVVANNQLNFANEMMDGFGVGVDGVGGVNKVMVGPPTVDGPGELKLFRSVPKSGQDGVSVFTLSPELFAGPLSETGKAGVPVIAVDNPPGPGAHVPLFVGNDNYQLGQMLADEVIKKLPPDASGKVIIGTSTPGVPVLDLRANGMRDEFHKRLPKVTVLGPFDSKQDVVANLAAWRVLVQANRDALAFLGTGDADGWNLAAIRRSTHASWLAGAYDLDPRSLQAVKAGDLLLVSPEHFLKGAIAGRLQAEHAKNGTALPQGWLLTPGLAVTQANVDAVSARQASVASRKAWFAPEVADILGHVQAHLRPMPAV
jgi:ribose transport system substrate-binding protein